MQALNVECFLKNEKCYFFLYLYTSFLLLFQLWVPGNEFFPDCYMAMPRPRVFLPGLFISFYEDSLQDHRESILFVYHAFSRREIQKNRIFQASLKA